MKSLNFVFTIECITFITISLFFIIHLKNSTEVAVYKYNYQLPWDKDKNTNVKTVLELTYSPNDTCLLINGDFKRYEEKISPSIFIYNKTGIRKFQQQKSDFGKLFFFVMFHVIIFIILPSIFMDNFNMYYMDNYENEKLIETEKFSSTKNIRLTITNHKHLFDESFCISGKVDGSLYKFFNNSLDIHSKFDKKISIICQEYPFCSYC